MKILSFDPGEKCGICFLRYEGENKVDVIRSETVSMKTVECFDSWLEDFKAVACCFEGHTPTAVIMEGSWPGPMGSDQRATHDERHGWIRHGIWHNFHMPVCKVSPTKNGGWKAAYGLVTKRLRGETEKEFVIRKTENVMKAARINKGIGLRTVDECCAFLMGLWWARRNGGR